MRLPDFLIIGAAKAGTTSLHALLAQHPGIFMSNPKEPEFFARDDRYSNGIQSYSDIFSGAAPGQICGEASTIYSLNKFFPKTPQRIASHLPNVKFIYMLRNPIDRAYSYYLQIVKNRQNATGENRVRRSFEECIFPDLFPDRASAEDFFATFDCHLPDSPDLFLAGSRYADQISAYSEHFPTDRFLFLLFEDFVADQKLAIQQVLSFLGQSPMPVTASPRSEVRRNISLDHFQKMEQASRRVNLRRRMGQLAALRHLFPTGLRRKIADHFVQNLPGMDSGQHVPPPMQPATRTYLEQYFAPQIPICAQMTGLDLSSWRLSDSGLEARNLEQGQDRCRGLQ